MHTAKSITPIRTLRAVFCAFLLLGIVSGCGKTANEEATLQSIVVGVAPPLEMVARTMVDAFNRVNSHGIPLAVAVSAGSDFADTEGGEHSAIIEWRKPEDGKWSALLGWTGIRFVVHPANPLADLSSADAKKIYSGWIGRWEDVQGPTGEIHAFALEDESGWTDMFAGAVLGTNRLSTGAILAPTIEAMRSAVRKDPLSMGFAPGWISLPELRLLTIDGINAEYSNFLSGRYPFRVPIYLESDDPPPAEIEQFTGWIQSVPGQTVLMQLHTQE